MERGRPETVEERQATLDQLKEQVRGFTSGEWKVPMDEGMVEPVAVMMANGFTTRLSCEGHMDPYGQFHTPYIYFAPFPPDKSLAIENDLLRDQLSFEMKRQKAVLGDLLEKFYEDRERDEDSRLVIKQLFEKKPWYGFRMSNELRGRTSFSPGELTEEIYLKCKGEMNAFTDFLRERYLEGE